MNQKIKIVQQLRVVGEEKDFSLIFCVCSSVVEVPIT